MMRYRVYLWRDGRTQAAQLVEDVTASDADAAIQAVMYCYTISRVYYAWVISPDDETMSVHRYGVRCAVSWVRPGGR